MGKAVKNCTRFWRVAVNHTIMIVDTATGEMRLEGEGDERVLGCLNALGLTLEALAQPLHQHAPRPKPKKVFRTSQQGSPAALSLR